MKTVTVIIGKTFSGKSTLVQQMEHKGLGNSVKLHTTRPIREGEIDGVDYYFDEVDELLESVTQEKCILTHYNVLEDGGQADWYYSLFLSELLTTPKPIVILDINKLSTIIDWSVDNDFNIEIIYVNTPQDVIEHRIQTSFRSREAFDETRRRLKDDNRKFKQFEENLLSLGLTDSLLHGINIYKVYDNKGK